MDIVAGFLKIDQKDDTHEIIVKHPVLKPDTDGWVHFVLQPQHARHLANLLVEYATYAEDEIAGLPSESRRDRRINRLKKQCV